MQKNFKSRKDSLLMQIQIKMIMKEYEWNGVIKGGLPLKMATPCQKSPSYYVAI